jgi:hypothetical protein
MPFTPVAGKFAVAEIENASSDIAIPGFDWTLTLNGNPQEVDNFRDGVQTMVTQEVAEGSLSLYWDEAAPPHLSAQGTVKPGTALTLNLYTDAAKTANKSFVVPARITQCELVNGGTKERLIWRVSFRQHGSITYPTA